MDYTVFYKSSYLHGNVDCGSGYDFFFSGYDECDRTSVIFDKITAREKFWINFPHYRLTPAVGHLYQCTSLKEDECFIDLFAALHLQADSRVCVDITGFVRPHLIFFITLLHRAGIKLVDFIYYEPKHYEKAEETIFSGFPEEPRIIEGCGSNDSSADVEKDLLIVTAGYDDQLVAAVSKYKSRIKKKYYILGLPSLQADMYQESILKLYQAQDSIGTRIDRYAPAFDPFVAAQAINEIVHENPGHNNIYLSPLSTKPHTLGIALYYLWNFQSLPINIIFPFSKIYKPKTAIGVKKTWKYTVQFPSLP